MAKQIYIYFLNCRASLFGYNRHMTFWEFIFVLVLSSAHTERLRVSSSGIFFIVIVYSLKLNPLSKLVFTPKVPKPENEQVNMCLGKMILLFPLV